MMNSFTIPRKPKFAAKTPPQHLAVVEEPKPTERKQPISRKKSTMKRSVELIDDTANDVPSNAAKRSKKSIRSDDRSAVEAAAPPTPPVYQKIKAGRTLGYPITVTQDGVNRNSQHDAILLNCNDENPEEYLAKFAYNDKVKIKWVHAGYNDSVAVGTITLKKMHAAPPTRKAAADSGLLLQQSSDIDMRGDDNMHEDEDDDAPILKARLNQMLERGDEGENDKDENYNDQEDRDEPLVCYYTKTSSVGFLNRKEGGQSAVGFGTGGNLEGGANNDGEDVSNNNLGEGGTMEVNEGGTDWGGDGSNLVFIEEATPEAVTSNVAIKTDDIDTDDETTHQDKDGPLPQQVLSNAAIKTDDIDTDTEESYQDKNGPMPQQVLSNMAIKTDGVDTDTEETYHQDKDGPLPEPVASSRVIKTDDIDADTEETNQDKNGSVPELVTSSMAIKTDDIDTDTEEVFGTDTLRDRLQAIVEQSDLNGDVLYQYDVRKRLEKWFCRDLTKHQYDIYYALNEMVEKHFGRIPSWLVKGVIVEVKKLRRKGSIKSIVEKFVSVEFDDMTTTSINYWHLSHVQPQVNDMVLSTAGKYLDAEGFLVAVTGENAVVNIGGNTITVEYCSLARICNFGVEEGRKRFCSDCKELKYTKEFPQDQRYKNEATRCNLCKSREFLKCVTCNISKRRLDHFTSIQMNKRSGASCIECEVKLVCSTCKVSKSAGLFSESQKSRGDAACCKKCEVVLLCSKCKVSKSGGLFSRGAICKECDVLICSKCKISKSSTENFSKAQRKKREAAVCNQCLTVAKISLVCSVCKVVKNKWCAVCECQVAKAPVVDTHCTVGVTKIKTPVTAEQGKKGGEQRLCPACNMSKNSDKFSKNQLRKGEKARCRECLLTHAPTNHRLLQQSILHQMEQAENKDNTG